MKRALRQARPLVARHQHIGSRCLGERRQEGVIGVFDIDAGRQGVDKQSLIERVYQRIDPVWLQGALRQSGRLTPFVCFTHRSHTA